jgi:hypothetical protein
MAKRKRKDDAAPPSASGWLRKAWHFLWYEDSLASWLVNIVLAFVLIKFILYPGMGLVLGTKFPVVAVVSSSMEHHPGNFDDWWVAKNIGASVTNEDFYLRYNITKFDFQNYAFRSGFNKGDIMILAGVDPYTVHTGTVIVYWSGKPYPIIHRYIGNNTEKGQFYLMSKGDNNGAMLTPPRSMDLDESRIPPERVIGKAVARIPYLGYVKIWAVDLLNRVLGK